jgi:hypothetical protein
VNSGSVVAGITWLISLLNPASAFIKACKMIYDVIMFFVTRGKQILDLVNAVIDSVSAIAKGAISVAANAVENALAKALPVAISFLASLLGLDGISEKIKTIIAKIQAPINTVIDWVIHQAVALVKGIAGLFSGGKDKDKKEEYGPEKQAKIDAGLITMKNEEAKYLKSGKIAKSDAFKVANAVKAAHPVFTTFTAEEAEKKINFYYTASAKTKADGLDISEEGGQKDDLGLPGKNIVIKEGTRRFRANISKTTDADNDIVSRMGDYAIVKIVSTNAKHYKRAEDVKLALEKKEIMYEAGTVTAEMKELLKNPLFYPGPNAVESITATSEEVTREQSYAIQPIGNRHGCHHGGSKSPSESWVADHQPVSALLRHKLFTGPQRLYPHSPNKSSQQGAAVTNYLKVFLGE